MAGSQGDHDCAAAAALTIDDHGRLERFQAKCAAMREKTTAKLARLATKRSTTRRTIGVTSERMQEWLDEHQAMLRAQQQRDP